MRILHVIGSLDPSAGGPAQSVRTLMGYRALGYEGEVVCMDQPDAPHLQNLSFPVTALGTGNPTFAYSSRLMPWLRANYHRFDGVILNGIWNYVTIAGWRALHGKVPYMVFAHGMLDPYFKRRYPLKHLKKLFYWHLLQSRPLRDAYRVLFTTEQERVLAEESFARVWTPHVVPYGTNGPPASEEECLAAFHADVPSLHGKRFLAYLGRIHQKKGCDMLISAFGKAAAVDPDLHLLMAGPDQTNWKSTLIASAQSAGVANRIHWPGILTGNAKWGALFASEAFILPSHQENFGIAVAEALSCGRPVLLSDQVNIAPEIAEAGAGLMEPDTPEGTDRLLHRWVTMPAAERDTIRTRTVPMFQSRYDMRATARTIISLFEQSKQQSSATR